MKYIAILNGPNLNLLGIRNKEVYGNRDFATYLAALQEKTTGAAIRYFQSNIEGELINEIQQCGLDSNCAGIVLNAGGYTHTSIAIADAVEICRCPVISVHISNIFAREPERKTDLLAAKCRGMICGLGLEGYELAVNWLLTNVDSF